MQKAYGVEGNTQRLNSLTANREHIRKWKHQLPNWITTYRKPIS